jgi:very-short-patch-repair endonuclease
VPLPLREYVVREKGRVLGHVDFAYPGARIFIELDGYAAHSAPGPFDRDRARQTDLVLYGWRPLRFTWKDVTRKAERMCGRIRFGLGLTHVLER